MKGGGALDSNQIILMQSKRNRYLLETTPHDGL